MAIIFQSWLNALQSHVEWSSLEFAYWWRNIRWSLTCLSVVGAVLFLSSSLCCVGVVAGCHLSPLSLCTLLDPPRVAHILGALHPPLPACRICGKFIEVEPFSSPSVDLKTKSPFFRGGWHKQLPLEIIFLGTVILSWPSVKMYISKVNRIISKNVFSVAVRSDSAPKPS
jgi:hypothetical protein